MLGSKVFVDKAQVRSASGIEVCRVGSYPVGLGSEWRNKVDVTINPDQRGPPSKSRTLTLLLQGGR